MAEAVAKPIRPGRSLRGHLLRRLAVVALGPAALIGLGAIAMTYRAEQHNLSERLAISAALSASAVDAFLQAHSAAVQLVAGSAGNDTRWPDTLDDLRTAYPAVMTALVTDARGEILASSPRANRPRRNVADREYFAAPMRTGKPHVSDAFIGRGFGNDRLIAVSAPRLRDGRPAGVVEASIPVSAFVGLRSDALRRRGYEMLVLDRTGRVVHASTGLPFAFRQDLSRHALLAARIPARGTLDGVLRGGGDAYVARVPMRGGWSFLLLAPESSLTGPLKQRLWTLFAMLLIAAIGAATAVHVEIGRFTGQLLRALRPLETIARDERPHAPHTPGLPHELLPLARAIDDLGHRLQNARDDNAELDRLNRTDALTGALNRRGMGARIDALRALAPHSPVAVLAFDVDHFKKFNDRYGHGAGDTVLRRVASTIVGHLRAPRDVLGRMGGEEFDALLAETGLDAALIVAERIRAAIEALDIPHEDAPGGRLTVSIGVHAASGPGDDALLDRADEALYRAKNGGRNRIAT